MSDARWSPLVFGRLLRADEWWQAVPETGVPATLDRAVRATHDNGNGLDGGRVRFLLAQDGHVRLVGVACAVAELAESFAADQHGRPTYCLVGWVAPVGSEVPSLPELRRHYVSLAGPVYRDVVTSRWTLLSADARRAAKSTPGPAPWPRPGRSPAAAMPAPGRWPADRADDLWRDASAERRPLVLAVGWQRAPRSHDVLTHVAADNVTRHQEWPPADADRPPIPQARPDRAGQPELRHQAAAFEPDAPGLIGQIIRFAGNFVKSRRRSVDSRIEPPAIEAAHPRSDPTDPLRKKKRPQHPDE